MLFIVKQKVEICFFKESRINIQKQILALFYYILNCINNPFYLIFLKKAIAVECVFFSLLLNGVYNL
jgi:hypothetical protein